MKDFENKKGLEVAEAHMIYKTQKNVIFLQTLIFFIVIDVCVISDTVLFIKHVNMEFLCQTFQPEPVWVYTDGLVQSVASIN